MVRSKSSTVTDLSFWSLIRFPSIILTASVTLSPSSRTRIQAYCSSKHAVLGLTRQLAMELGPWSITVNSVAPGLALTDARKQADWDALGADVQRQTLAGIALGRLVEPQDIADATMFFASDLARFVTGQVLPVNGGSF